MNIWNDIRDKMWNYYRIKEGRGFVSKRIMARCLYLTASIFGFSVVKDGQIITDFFKAMEVWQKSFKEIK